MVLDQPNQPLDFTPDNGTPPAQNNQLDFNPVPPQNVVPQAAVANRAAKADFTLGAVSPGVANISTELQNNGDQRLQDLMRQKQQVDFEAAKQNMINRMITTQQGPITDDQAAFVRSLSQQQFADVSKYTDPMASEYAKQYMSNITARNLQTYSTAEVAHPEVTNAIRDTYEDGVYRNQIAQKAVDNIQSQQESQGFLSAVGDFVGANFPLAGLRTNNAATSGGGILPGENIQHQVSYLHSLPTDQFETAFNKALNNIPNLSQKKEFAQAVIQYSDFDAVSRTVMAAADAAGLGEGAFSLGKSVGKGLAKTGAKEVVGDLSAHPESPPTAFSSPRGTEVSPYQVPNDASIPGKAANNNATDDTVTKFQKLRTDTVQAGNDNTKPVGAFTPTNDTSVPAGTGNDNFRTGGVQPNVSLGTPAVANDDATGARVANNNSRKVPGQGSSVSTSDVNHALAANDQQSRDVFGTAANDDTLASRGTNVTPGAPANDTAELRNSVNTNATAIQQMANDNRLDRVFNVVASNENGDAGEAMERMNSVYRGALNASKNPMLDVGDIAEKTGDFKTAAIVNDSKNAADYSAIPDDVKVRQNAMSINGGANQFFDAGSNLGREAQDRLTKIMGSNEAKANSFFDHLNVDRDTVTNQIAARDAAYDAFVRNSNIEPLQSSILDLQGDGKFYQTEHSAIGQTEAIHIHLGKPNGELFGNRAAAQKFMDDNLSGFNNTVKSIYSTRGGYAIRMTQDVPDAINAYAGLRFEPHERFTEDFKNGMLKGFLGAARNQKNVLGEGNAQARLNVVHGAHKLMDVQREILEPLRKLKGEKLDELTKVLVADRDYVNRATGDRGRYLSDLGAFEDEFFNHNGHLPNEQQTAAYYSSIQANDLHYMVLSYSERRDKIAAGIKSWTNSFVNRDADGARSSISHTFEGKEIPELPMADRDEGTDFNVAYKDPVTGELRTTSKKYLSPASEDYKKIKDIQAGGGKVIQISNNNLGLDDYVKGSRPKSVGFYVSDGLQEGRVSADSAYRPGGHVINAGDAYLKQPIIKDGVYRGDLSWRSVSNKRLADKLAEHAETARQMMLRNDPKFDEYVSKNLGEGMTGDDFRNEFVDKRTRDGIQPGLDPNQPIVSVNKGQRTGDVIKFPNGTLNTQKSPYNLLRDLDRTFTGERDSANIPAYYEERNTVKIHNDGDVIDPLQALQAGARNIVDRRLKHDYIMKSANQWVHQFQDLLEQPWEQLARNPRQQLLDPKFKKGGDQVLLNNAMNSRNSILRFAAIGNREEGWLDSVASRLATQVSDTMGEGLISNGMLAFAKDPARLARSFAFHTKLGLFNPVQLFLQAQTLANVVALSPVKGLKSAMMALPMRAALINPAMFEHSLGVAKAFGWKDGQFAEMMNAMIKSGWHDVHGSYAALDDLNPPKLFKSTYGKVLDAGTTFFNEGERVNRLVSFATAYLEHADKFPGAEIDNRALTRIMSRADDMTVNMSAANNAVWQKGLAAIPAQFQTYQARLTEQYLSNTLTKAERARLFATHSLLFGAPTALGGAIGVWPMYDSIKSYMLDNNIPHDDAITKTVIDGLPGMLMAKGLGLDMDAGTRYGTGGASMFHDLWTGKKNLGQIMFGSFGEIGEDVIGASLPAAYAIKDMITGNPNGIYPIDAATLTMPLRDISSVNNSMKLYYGMTTGRWLNKQGLPVDDITPGEATMGFAFGLTPTRDKDMYLLNDIQKGYNDGKNGALKQAEVYLTRADQLQEGDPQRAEYMRMAKAAIIISGGTADDVIKMMTRHLVSKDQTQFEKSMRGFHYDAIKRANAQGMLN